MRRLGRKENDVSDIHSQSRAVDHSQMCGKKKCKTYFHRRIYSNHRNCAGSLFKEGQNRGQLV